MNQTKVWISIRDSFWFVPTCYSIIAMILVILFHNADRWIISSFKYQIPEILITSPETARALYAALVTAILTMTTISFSVIMLVLTTYSSQFSPRTLQDFMRSKMTHHVLGMFCLGFIFALTYLVLMDKQEAIIGPILMAVIAIICLAFFVYFIHYSARWLQVNNLIGKISFDSSRVINNTFAEKKIGEHESFDEEEVYKIKNQPMQDLLAIESGYVQKIEWTSLVNLAAKHGCVIDLHVQIGDYVTKDLPIASLYFKDQPYEKMDRMLDLIIIGTERTDIEDIEFIIQKLVEIAVKAISPSINDPHTAINSINRIGSMLSELGKVYKEVRYMTDQKNNLRIIKYPKRFEDYLYKSFYQIKHYANGDVSIYYNLVEILYKIAVASDDRIIKRKIWEFHYYIVESIEWDSLQNLDRHHLESIYKKLKGSCGK
ncbi:DUF2254 domain-containing protein [Aquibacillus halophilus]|uniref:DUF2254 domain-containing protein n=1 Tax=Aquibacillus halophilus TaxID=930132 RepID=A0A6A8D9Z3_9BACI|nr:DUF2254 domain-containing protein [Aquibacillus halophilus]MRH41356.1 DUF2254 domain-containing protein [Aquibacillus halophilus]